MFVLVVPPISSFVLVHTFIITNTGIDKTLAEYELWLGESVPSELTAEHEKALAILNSCNRHENEVVRRKKLD